MDRRSHWRNRSSGTRQSSTRIQKLSTRSSSLVAPSSLRWIIPLNQSTNNEYVFRSPLFPHSLTSRDRSRLSIQRRSTHCSSRRSANSSSTFKLKMKDSQSVEKRTLTGGGSSALSLVRSIALHRSEAIDLFIGIERGGFGITGIGYAILTFLVGRDHSFFQLLVRHTPCSKIFAERCGEQIAISAGFLIIPIIWRIFVFCLRVGRQPPKYTSQYVFLSSIHREELTFASPERISSNFSSLDKGIFLNITLPHRLTRLDTRQKRRLRIRGFDGRQGFRKDGCADF